MKCSSTKITFSLGESLILHAYPTSANEHVNPTSTAGKKLPLLTQLLTRLSQRLPHPSRQLVPNETSKDHDVLGSALALRDDILLSGRVELGSLEARVLVGQSDDGPDHDVADRAGHDGLHAVEGLCLGTDGGHVAGCVGGEHLGAFDVLEEMLVNDFVGMGRLGVLTSTAAGHWPASRARRASAR